MGDPSKGLVVRTTYHLPVELTDRIRDIAFWDRLNASDVVAEALREHADARESRRGEPYPKRTAPVKYGRKPA